MDTSTIGNSLPAYQPSTSSGQTSFVSQSSNSGLAQISTSLAQESAIVSSLGGGSASAITYDAAGIYNSIAQAGASNATPQASTVSTVPSTATASAAPSSTTNTSTSGGIGSGSGSSTAPSTTILGASSSAVSSNWSAALKANPSLAGTVIADSSAQAIIGNLIAIA